MKTYLTNLHGVKTLADIVAQLDHVKNLLPKGSLAQQESSAMIDHGHDVLERMLGRDIALVYRDPESDAADGAATKTAFLPDPAAARSGLRAAAIPGAHHETE